MFMDVVMGVVVVLRLHSGATGSGAGGGVM